VDSTLIHDLRMIEASREFDDPEPGNGQPILTEGDRIKITGGQFSGLCGILKKLRPNKRAKVLIEMFGRSSPAELPIAQLSAA
jgi:transcription antitermination factor NusG